MWLTKINEYLPRLVLAALVAAILFQAGTILVYAQNTDDPIQGIDSSGQTAQTAVTAGQNWLKFGYNIFLPLLGGFVIIWGIVRASTAQRGGLWLIFGGALCFAGWIVLHAIHSTATGGAVTGQ